MSTYLLAFVVGDLQATRASLELRRCASGMCLTHRISAGTADFGQQIAKFSLEFFEVAEQLHKRQARSARGSELRSRGHRGTWRDPRFGECVAGGRAPGDQPRRNCRTWPIPWRMRTRTCGLEIW